MSKNLAALESAAAVSSSAFTPAVFLAKNGEVKASVKVRGGWQGFSLSQVVEIAKDVDGFVSAANKALELSKDPNERQRLIDAKAGKTTPSPNVNVNVNDELAKLARG